VQHGAQEHVARRESRPAVDQRIERRLYQDVAEDAGLVGGADGLVIVAVSVDKESSNITDFLKQVRVSFPIVHDQDHAVADRFKPPRMPSSYIVDRKGIVRHVHGGFRPDDAAALEAEIKALLAK